MEIKVKLTFEGAYMGRCPIVEDLEVHHKRTDGGNKLENAQVLCKRCHTKTDSFGKTDHKQPPDFPMDVRVAAMHQSEERCECTRADCGFH